MTDKASCPQAKKRKMNNSLLVENRSSDDDNLPAQKLLWCHPEIAKGFNGCRVGCGSQSLRLLLVANILVWVAFFLRICTFLFLSP